MSAGRGRRRPAVQITTTRAARLYRLVRMLDEGPRERGGLLRELGIGLRTFYRETELLRRVGIRVRLEGRRYAMHTRFKDAESRLPFPDPRVTFAEMRVLAGVGGEVGQRMSALYEDVLAMAAPPEPRKTRGRGGSARK